MESFKSIRNSFETLTQGLGHLYNAEEAKSVSKILLTAILGEEWFHLTGKWDESVSEILQEKLWIAYKRLAKHEPIQYVIGKAHFYGRDFYVSPSVLIPRGETEELMIWVRDSMLSQRKESKSEWKILDIGTGSGCIPISLALELEDKNIVSEIHGLDVSMDALNMARRNNALYKTTVFFQQTDILKAHINDKKNLDIIISNPPYVPTKEQEEMAPHVLEHEPSLALFVPNEDPLIFYKKIVQLATGWLKPRGMLFFEIHEEMGEETLKLFKEDAWAHSELRKDIHGKDRMIMGRKQ